MGQLSKRLDNKRSRHEDSREIEQVKMKQPVRCWRCGGHHLRWDCLMREHDEGNSRKVPRLRGQLEAENQQKRYMEAERLGLERSK